MRLYDFFLCKLRAVGDTTRRGDVVIDRGHIDSVRYGDAFETLGYYDHFDRREGNGKVLFAFHRCLHLQGCFAIGGATPETP